MNTTDAVIDAFNDVLALDKDELMSEPDRDLVADGLIDSLGIVSLIRYIEKKTGIKIALSKMKPQDFHSVNSISAAVDRQRGE